MTFFIKISKERHSKEQFKKSFFRINYQRFLKVKIDYNSRKHLFFFQKSILRIVLHCIVDLVDKTHLTNIIINENENILKGTLNIELF
jgi:hypothetical protein